MVTNYFSRMFKSRDGGVVVAMRRRTVKMGSRLKEIYSVELLDAWGREQQKQWEEESRRRQWELQQQKIQSEQRRKNNQERLAQMSARWRNLEDKRHQRSMDYLDRMRISLSQASRPDLETRQEAFTPATIR